ncbi:hypothetical protein K2173_023853 [Erythroxylum novogranatense]|uniref:F-box domain-containing protein n=1 Tax=Erythroxylum novogranatense TaxID=1862640 RepID=A0AAV8TSU1_9ROSI|nr:hypothetical protein K2173_023853 [Erythroxylum novogranatense]
MALPRHLISHILTRVPAPTLRRFKKNCKQWGSEIGSSFFVRKQVDYVSRTRYREGAVLSSSARSLQFLDCENMRVELRRIDFPFDGRRGVSVIGSCNGLFCLAWMDKVLVLWNPCTKVCRDFAISGPVVRRHYGLNWLGFGYDGTRDEYKILRLHRHETAQIMEGTQVDIFSSKTNSWKELPILRWEIGLVGQSQPGTLVDHALHWLVEYVTRWENFEIDGIFRFKTVAKAILRFDLVEEKPSLILIPPDIDCRHPLYEFELRGFGGFLSLTHHNEEGHIDMWRVGLDKFKEIERFSAKFLTAAWTKIITIPCMTQLPLNKRLEPLWLMEDGKLLLHVQKIYGFITKKRKRAEEISVEQKKFYVYDPKSEEFSGCEIKGCKFFNRITAHSHTLLSPNSF